MLVVESQCQFCFQYMYNYRIGDTFCNVVVRLSCFFLRQLQSVCILSNSQVWSCQIMTVDVDEIPVHVETGSEPSQKSAQEELISQNLHLNALLQPIFSVYGPKQSMKASGKKFICCIVYQTKLKTPSQFGLQI